MPSDRYLKLMNGAHKGLLRLSGGRFGWAAMDMPVLVLTTTGRRSGQPRSVMLTSPHREGQRMVIVASKGGEDSHPAWFLNLRENPQVTVSMKDASDVLSRRTRPTLAGRFRQAGPLRRIPGEDRSADPAGSARTVELNGRSIFVV